MIVWYNFLEQDSCCISAHPCMQEQFLNRDHFETEYKYKTIFDLSSGHSKKRGEKYKNTYKIYLRIKSKKTKYIMY